jgi:gas vesicle protein
MEPIQKKEIKMPTISRQRSNHRKALPSDKVDNTTLILGVAAVGLVGLAAAVLCAPKKHDFIDDVSDTYHDFQDKASDFLNGFANKGKCALSAARDGIRETSSNYLGYPEKECNISRNLAIGALAGGIIGTVAYVLFATPTGKHLQADIKHGYNDAQKRTNLFSNAIKDFSESAADNFKSMDWMSVASDLVDLFSDKAKHYANEVKENVEDEIENSKLGKVINLGLIGLRLLQNMKSRR